MLTVSLDRFIIMTDGYSVICMKIFDHIVKAVRLSKVVMTEDLLPHKLIIVAEID